MKLLPGIGSRASKLWHAAKTAPAHCRDSPSTGSGSFHPPEPTSIPASAISPSILAYPHRTFPFFCRFPPQELGIHATVAALHQSLPPPTSTPSSRSLLPRKQHQSLTGTAQTRRSSRVDGAMMSYNEEDKFRELGIGLLPRRHPSYRSLNLTPEELEALRHKIKSDGSRRGGVDSGKGVRVQGGRVYDSALGVTCHWCRQKTLEDHVECTSEDCGNGSRLPVAFCRRCLLNRHGEDIYLALASGSWVCPPCRGSCGDGCVTCCNCGPCRKAANLTPTHQVIKLARAAGFDNVHDYLVHSETGEDAVEIAQRKSAFDWGKWLGESLMAGGDEENEEVDIVGGGGEGTTQQQEVAKLNTNNARNKNKEKEDDMVVAMATENGNETNDGLLEKKQNQVPDHSNSSSDMPKSNGTRRRSGRGLAGVVIDYKEGDDDDIDALSEEETLMGERKLKSKRGTGRTITTLRATARVARRAADSFPEEDMPAKKRTAGAKGRRSSPRLVSAS